MFRLPDEVRQCKRCERELPLTEEFFRSDGDGYYRWKCRRCENRQLRVRQKKNPKARETRRRLAKEYMKRVRADPERRRMMNETRRIAYRLRFEREGRDLDSIQPGFVRDRIVESPRVDVGLLRESVVRRIETGELSWAEAARACGYVGKNGNGKTETSQLKRNLGVMSYHSRGSNGLIRGLSWETAARIAKSLDIDLQEVGL